MTFDRPPREVYVRASREHAHGASIDLGLEYRDGDSTLEMRVVLVRILDARLDSLLVLSEPFDAMANALAIEKMLKTQWPDRAYFIESWWVGDGSWVQVFQPYGVPRNAP